MGSWVHDRGDGQVRWEMVPITIRNGYDEADEEMGILS